MGERALSVALTAVLLIILVLLYILYMRTNTQWDIRRSPRRSVAL
jgi:uncharacterized protein (DUF58 family)